MKRIYVAGAFSANNVLVVMENIRKGMRPPGGTERGLILNPGCITWPMQCVVC